MTTEAAPSTRRGEGQGGGREFPWRMPGNWWTRKRHYVQYMLREFTALPMALWLLWLLVEIQRASNGPAHYSPHSSTGFIVFSVIVLLFSLYHSVTFLSLAGTILHFKLFDKPVPSRLIVLSQFGGWLVASLVVGFVLVWFAR